MKQLLCVKSVDGYLTKGQTYSAWGGDEVDLVLVVADNGAPVNVNQAYFRPAR